MPLRRGECHTCFMDTYTACVNSIPGIYIHTSLRLNICEPAFPHLPDGSLGHTEVGRHTRPSNTWGRFVSLLTADIGHGAHAESIPGTWYQVRQ